jgi:hypothetical protein
MTSTPDMKHPVDRQTPSQTSQPAYPQPAKTKVASKPANELDDPAGNDPSAPHDRGVQKADGRYEDAVDDMVEQTKGAHDEWRKAQTQNGAAKN